MTNSVTTDTDVTQVSTSTEGNNASPSITWLSDGGYVIVWGGDQGDNGTDIMLRRYDADGAPVGSITTLNSYTTDDQFNPEVAATADGGYIVVWTSQGQDGSGGGIYFQRFDGDNQALDSGDIRANQTTASGQVNPAITVLTGGRFFVTWESWTQDGDNYGVYGRLFAADGTAITDETRINASIGGPQRQPSVTSLSDGGYIIAWHGDAPGGSYFDVYTQRYDSNGDTDGNLTRVNTTMSDHQLQSSIASLADGGYVVTWASAGQDGAQYGIYMQRFSSAGTASGTETRVNTTTAGSQMGSRVAALGDGGWVVVWMTSATDAYYQSTSSVQAQVYDAEGAAVGGEIAVSSTGSLEADTYPEVAATATGFVVTWGGNAGYRWDGTSVWQRSYSLADLTDAAPALTGAQDHLADTLINHSVTITRAQLLSGYSDGDNDALSVTHLSADHGTVHDNGDNSWTITPATDYLGTVTLSYDVSDDILSTAATQSFDAVSVLAGTVHIVNTTTSGIQRSPVVTHLAGGGYVIIWSMTESPNVVQAQLYDADGNPVGEEQTLNTYNDSGQYTPSVAARADGGYVVAWASNAQDGDSRGIYVATFDSDGDPLSGILAVNQRTEGDENTPKVSVLSNGNFAVTWQGFHNDTGLWTIHVRLYDGDGTALTNEITTSSTDHNNLSPSVIALADGGFIVTWAGFNDTTGYDLVGRRYDADGDAVGNEFHLTNDSGSEFSPQFAVLNDGSFVATWQGIGTVAQHFNADGSAAGSAFQVSMSGGNAKVAALDNGGWVVVWETMTLIMFPMMSMTYTARGQVYGADGDADGSAFVITSGSASTSVNVAGHGDGFVTTWTGGTSDIYQRIYTLPEPPNAVPELSGAQNELAGTTMNRPVTFTEAQLLSGYSDDDGDTLSVTNLTADHGSVHDNGDGTYTITPAGGYTGAVTLSYDVGDGTDVVAATQGFDVQAYVAGAAERVNTFTDGFQGAPVSTWLSTGSRVVAWNGDGGDDNGGDDVFFQLYSAGGDQVGDQTRVNSFDSDNQSGAGVAALGDGVFAVVWSSYYQDGDSYGIFLRRFGADGLPLDDNDIRVNTTTSGDQASVAITALGAGRFFVTWTSDGQDGDDSGVYGKLYDSDLSDGGEFRINTTTEGGQRQPAVAVLAGGGFAVTWSGNGSQDGSDGEDIWIQRYDSTGVKAGVETRVNTAAANAQNCPAIAGLEDGGYVVTWQTSDSDGYGIHAQRFDSSGHAIGAEFAVNTTTLHDQNQPKVVGLADGGWVIAWQSGTYDWDADTSLNDVYAQVYNAEGDTLGDEIRVTDATSIGWEVQIGLLATETGFIITWTGNPTDGWAHPDAWQRSYTTSLSATITTTGTSGNNDLDGTGGITDMTGLGGGDTYHVDSTADAVHESSDGGLDEVDASISYVLDDNVEDLILTGTNDIDGTGNDLNNMITGNAGANRLDGGDGEDTMSADAGNDSLDGGAGNDNLTGGTGDDTYYIDTDYDTVVEEAESGTDLIIAAFTGDVGFTIYDFVENLEATCTGAADLSGNDANNSISVSAVSAILNGGAGDDTLSSTGLNSDDLLIGGGGSDVLSGGTGDDTYSISSTDEQVLEDADSGIDTVETYVSLELGDNVENLTLSGSDAINATGNTLGNILVGNSGNNHLYGAGGDDNLYGGAGDDTLTGGQGNDSYFINQAADLVVESEVENQGTDIVVTTLTSYTLSVNVENLTYVSFASVAFSGTGNASANIMQGAGGNDTLYGLVGNDTLTSYAGNDVLDGGAGADSMTGGAGADTYYVDNFSDQVTETDEDSESTDLVLSSLVVYTLADNVENLTLTGSALSGNGNELDNVVTGNSGNNSLTGDNGDDAILGDSGADILDGGAGSDTLSGGNGNDWLDGSTGGDIMNGGSGNDTFYIDNANDQVSETSNNGNDLICVTLTGYELDDDVFVESVTYIGSGNFTGTGNEWQNVLTGGAGNDSLDGGRSDDELHGGLGNDTMRGGDGNDVYFVDSSSDNIIEHGDDEGDDLVKATVSYTLSGNIERLTLIGGDLNGTGNGSDNNIRATSGANILSGGDGADTLMAFGGADSLAGGAGDDRLEGGDGNDTVHGGDGNDTVYGGIGDDYLDAGAGADDMAGYTGDDTYVVDDADDYVGESSDQGTDTQISTLQTSILADNVENLILGGTGDFDAVGNALDNVITGNAGANSIEGGEGADTMAGGGGSDTYYVDSEGDSVDEHDSTGTDVVYTNLTSYTLGDNLETLIMTGEESFAGTGNGLNNRLIGGSGDDTLTGAAGNDSLDGGAGVDTMIGGAGNDDYYVDTTGETVTEDAGRGTDTVHASVSSYTLTNNVENLIMEDGCATGTGNSRANTLIGNSSANTLDGLTGNDTMTGGDGDDSYNVGQAGDVVIEASGQGTDLVTATISYTLTSHVENLTLVGSSALKGTGNALGNSLAGNAYDNVLDGLTGADTMTGGAGDDIYYVDSSDDAAVEIDGQGLDTVFSTASFTLGTYVEKLYLNGGDNLAGTGNAQDNRIYGNGGENVLSGMDGNDMLTGGVGWDTMSGGAGDDIYYVDDSNDLTVESDGQGLDIVYSTASLTLAANIERLSLTGIEGLTGTGNAQDNRLYGNSGNNALSGLGGNDILDGGLGSDTLTGGSGDDIYYVDSTGDATVESDGQGLDTVYSTANYTLGEYIEKLYLSGGDGISGTGNAQDNRLYGNSGNNSLNGMAGNDSLDGGLGSDTLAGGLGDDSYKVDSSDDATVELNGQGLDTVYSSASYTLGDYIEALYLSGGDGLAGTGNAQDNRLYGNSGNNALGGLDGSDRLDGGLGDDTMTGGAGDDTYYVDSGNDIATELEAQGNDILYSSVSYTLSANIEKLYLTVGDALIGTGNAVDNWLTGNDNNNTLSGLDGNDRLDGGLGTDTMTGGAGDDTYYVDATNDGAIELDGQGLDFVYSTASYTLGDYIERLYLNGGIGISGTGNAQDNRITGNSGNNALSGLAGNDVLTGGLGTDTMTGGAGDDTYYVDNTDDITTELEAQGADTVFSSVAFTLSANIEKLYLTGITAVTAVGNALGNWLTGNSMDNMLDGLDGNDRLDGGIGWDTMTGGAGDDTYYVDTAADSVTELDGQGIDAVYTTTTYGLTSYVEKLYLSGSDPIDGTGNGLANTLTGNSGNNHLNGLAGNDTINGGLGDDTMTGGTGDDRYYVDSDDDVIVEAAGQGTDIVYTTSNYALNDDVENLTVSNTSGVWGYGNGLNNVITGNIGNDALYGGEGNDTLSGGLGGDQLDGSTGADVMAGGLGNDIYFIDETGDVVREYADSGHDAVYSSITTRLGTYVEDLYLTGTGNIDGTGNAYDNVIVSNMGNNNLTGGLGADMFVFYERLGNDVITDFHANQGDTLRIDGDISQATISQSGSSAVIVMANGDTITVLHTLATDAGFLGALTFVSAE